MSVITKLASMQNRKDDVPNQELAREIAKKKDTGAVKELVKNLTNKNIQSDCIKVLYEIGYIDPHLIRQYVDDFLILLGSKNNRLTWGGMIALSTIAQLEAGKIFERIDDLFEAIKKGSVITVDNGVKTLARVASINKQYSEKIFPFLMGHLQSCRPKEIPQHAESVSIAVTEDNRLEFFKILKERKDILKPSQLKRVEKLIRSLSQTQVNHD